MSVKDKKWYWRTVQEPDKDIALGLYDKKE